MRKGRKKTIAAALMIAGCAHEGSLRTPAGPSPDTSSPSSAPSPAVASVPTDDFATRGPAPLPLTPLPLPQSDPIPPPSPRCPNVGPLTKTSAIVKREASSRRRGATSPDVLDIELTITLPTSPKQVTFAPNHLTVAGGVIVQQTLEPTDHTKYIVLIRPAGTVAREGSLQALFGVECEIGEGNMRVDMTFALPPRAGDKVTIRRVEGY